MNLLDWLLVVLVVAYALSGYWQGFVTGAFATAGLLLGGLFGVWLAPVALGDADPSLLVSLGALFIVILAASLGQGLLQCAGAKIRDRITWQPVRAVDAIGGAALSACRGPDRGLGARRGRLGLADRRGDADGAQLAGALQGQRGAPAARRRSARRVQRRGRHQLLPPLPRAVLAGAHRRRRARRPPDAARPRRHPGRQQRAQGPRHQRLRPRHRGVRLRLRDGPADDQRARGGRGRRPAGRHRRRRGRRDVVFYDPDLDIAVLEFDSGAVPAMPFTAGEPGQAKDPIAILGYPQDGPFDIESRPDPREADAALARHLRRRRGDPRRLLAARAGPPRQLRRPDRRLGRARWSAWSSRRR